MSARLVAACLIGLAMAERASAHRLDEYLQATTLSFEKSRVGAEMVLTPGTSVFGRVMALIDTDQDGRVSKAEEQAYAKRVLGELSLSIDGVRRELQLTSVTFPPLAEMKEGRGGIRIAFAAETVPAGSGHRLVLENKHQTAMSAYLMNSLVPQDKGIQITGQNRNYQQSRYEVEFRRVG